MIRAFEIVISAFYPKHIKRFVLISAADLQSVKNRYEVKEVARLICLAVRPQL
jgi:hypothetical protein